MIRKKGQKAASREIVAINVDLSCTKECEGCERFFDCVDPKKREIYNRRRMQKVRKVMSAITYKLAIVGGKGGVGKSIVSANLACELALRKYKVSVLDQDFDGPSIPRMLGITERLRVSEDGIVPSRGAFGIDVISMGLILRDEEVLTWFHDMRRSATEEFLCHVVYGKRDFLVIDLPPGTSSDSVNLLSHIPDIDGAVVVTIPTEVSQGVARKAALLCRKAGVPLIGMIENMSGCVCPSCGARIDVLRSGGGESLAAELGIPFLGRIPMDPALSRLCDEGRPFVKHHAGSAAAQGLRRIADRIVETLTGKRI